MQHATLKGFNDCTALLPVCNCICCARHWLTCPCFVAAYNSCRLVPWATGSGARFIKFEWCADGSAGSAGAADNE